MAGGIYKTGAMTHIQPDARGLAFISKLPSLKDDVVLRGVAQELEDEGITIVESTRFLSSLVPQEGILTRAEPDAQQWQDIRLELRWQKRLVAGISDRALWSSVEQSWLLKGVEGTNAAIRRGGALGGEGSIVVKVSKPQQDLRFDVPAVGPDTITVMHEVQAAVLAIEAGKTLMIERPALLAHAQDKGIRVVAVGAQTTGEAAE